MRANKKILIVDDHQFLIDGLRGLLEQHGDAEVICASSVAEALALIEEQSFDIILLDLFFPGVDGFTLLKRGNIDAPVIVMSSTDDTSLIQNALDQGAAGFLSKGASLPTLLTAIDTVISGNTYIPPELVLQLNQGGEASIALKQETICKEIGLTPQNFRVLGLIAEGLSNKDIASKIFVSTETVKSHTKQIYAALQVNNRLSAVNEARRLGLLPD